MHKVAGNPVRNCNLPGGGGGGGGAESGAGGGGTGAVSPLTSSTTSGKSGMLELGSDGAIEGPRSALKMKN